jgi:hypothetical protein
MLRQPPVLFPLSSLPYSQLPVTLSLTRNIPPCLVFDADGGGRHRDRRCRSNHLMMSSVQTGWQSAF